MILLEYQTLIDSILVCRCTAWEWTHPTYMWRLTRALTTLALVKEEGRRRVEALNHRGMIQGTTIGEETPMRTGGN